MRLKMVRLIPSIGVEPEKALNIWNQKSSTAYICEGRGGERGGEGRRGGRGGGGQTGEEGRKRRGGCKGKKKGGRGWEGKGEGKEENRKMRRIHLIYTANGYVADMQPTHQGTVEPRLSTPWLGYSGTSAIHTLVSRLLFFIHHASTYTHAHVIARCVF